MEDPAPLIASGPVFACSNRLAQGPSVVIDSLPLSHEYGRRGRGLSSEHHSKEEPDTRPSFSALPPRDRCFGAGATALDPELDEGSAWASLGGEEKSEACATSRLARPLPSFLSLLRSW